MNFNCLRTAAGRFCRVAGWLTLVGLAFWPGERILGALRAHDAPIRASRLRWWYRFTSAEAVHRWLWFFFKPRKRTFTNPKMRFRMRKGCSTLDRTRPSPGSCSAVTRPPPAYTASAAKSCPGRAARPCGSLRPALDRPRPPDFPLIAVQQVR